MKTLLLTVLMLLGWYYNAMGQNPSELFYLALERNHKLNALREEYKAAMQLAPQLSQLPDPEIGLGAFVSPVETRLGSQRARISAAQMFPWFGTLQARKDWAVAEATVKQEAIATEELEVFYQIKTTWLNLYELDQSRTIIQKNLHLLTVLKEISESRVSSGKTTLADVLRIDLRIQEMEQELKILDSRKKKPLAVINQIVKRDLNTLVEIKETLSFAELTVEKDSLFASIHNHHPFLRMISQKQDVAQKAIYVNEKASKPSFGVGMDYIAVDALNDVFPENNGRDIFQLRATVSIPLYRKKYSAKEQQEKFRIQALEKRKKESESLFFSMIERAYSDHETAALMSELYVRQIETSRSAIRILQAEYSNKGKGFDELIRLEGMLIDYELKLLKAIVLSHMAKAEIERYLPLNQ